MSLYIQYYLSNSSAIKKCTHAHVSVSNEYILLKENILLILFTLFNDREENREYLGVYFDHLMCSLSLCIAQIISLSKRN